MTNSAPLFTTGNLLVQGYHKHYEIRRQPLGPMYAIAKELPADARLLLHEENERFGLWRPVISDMFGWQFALRYESLASAGELHDTFARLGVTHVLARPYASFGTDSLGADLRFFDYLRFDTEPLTNVAGWAIYPLAKTRPARARNELVAYLGCGRFYERGLHDLAKLKVREGGKRAKPRVRKAVVPVGDDLEDIERILGQADFAVVGPQCKPLLPIESLAFFIRIASRYDYEHMFARFQR